MMLATLSLGLAFAFVNARVATEVEAELTRDLNEAGTLVDQRRADFADTFESFANDTADYLVVPVENKIVGIIESPSQMLRTSEYRILERLDLKVRHVLAGTLDAEFESLLSIRSHVEALKQCKHFFAQNPQLQQIIGADTAGSIWRIVSEGISTNAAIGSRRASEMYGGKVLRKEIADDIDNWTTFCLIGR